MWTHEVTGQTTASPGAVFAVWAEPERWREWNTGVARIEMRGSFEAGTEAVMVLPDDTALPFTFAWVEPDRGFEDVTEVPDAGVVVRVRHEVTSQEGGARITYHCEVDGPEDVTADVGSAVTSDFSAVIEALATRAEGRDA